MKDKQTAIEWLYDRFLFAGYAAPTQWREQAKAMEKDQIIDAAHHGVDFENSPYKDAEEYYNKTYANDTTKGLPEEDSKRRAWHY